MFFPLILLSQINVGTNFRITTALPIDKRFVYSDTIQRNLLSLNERYEGLITFTESDKKYWKLTGGIFNSSWSELLSESSNYGGNTLSDNNNKTNKWEYIGYLKFIYNEDFNAGWSINSELKLLEQTNNGTKSVKNADEITLRIQANLDECSGTTLFDNTVPSMFIKVSGDSLEVSPLDFAILVYSSDISEKIMRIYVRLKESNTHYILEPVSIYGLSRSTDGSVSNSYCSLTTVSNQSVLNSLPTPDQGSITYGVFPYKERYYYEITIDDEDTWSVPFIINSNAIILYNGAVLSNNYWSGFNTQNLSISFKTYKYDKLTIIN